MTITAVKRRPSSSIAVAIAVAVVAGTVVAPLGLFAVLACVDSHLISHNGRALRTDKHHQQHHWQKARSRG